MGLTSFLKPFSCIGQCECKYFSVISPENSLIQSYCAAHAKRYLKSEQGSTLTADMPTSLTGQVQIKENDWRIAEKMTEY